MPLGTGELLLQPPREIAISIAAGTKIRSLSFAGSFQCQFVQETAEGIICIFLRDMVHGILPTCDTLLDEAIEILVDRVSQRAPALPVLEGAEEDVAEGLAQERCRILANFVTGTFSQMERVRQEDPGCPDKRTLVDARRMRREIVLDVVVNPPSTKVEGFQHCAFKKAQKLL